MDKACLRVPHIGLCHRQLEDCVVEDWWLFPRNLLLFWMRKITKQRGSEASPYSNGYFAWIARVIWLKYISPYVLAYLYPTEFHYKITTLIKKRWSLMIRMSEATWTRTPGQQLDCDILISSPMKHVLTNRPMFHSCLTQKNLGHKIYLLKNVKRIRIKREILRKKVRYGLWYNVHLSLARFRYSCYWIHSKIV